MNPLILGNILSLIGCIIMVATGFIKTKKRVLIVQCIQVAFLGLANLILGAYAGFISGMVAIARNLVFYRVKSTNTLKLLFIFIQIALTVRPDNFQIVEILPILAAITFTWYIDTDNEITFKKVIILINVFWLIYDFSYFNYMAMSFDFFTILSNLMGIKMIKNDKSAE